MTDEIQVCAQCARRGECHDCGRPPLYVVNLSYLTFALLLCVTCTGSERALGDVTRVATMRPLTPVPL